VALGDIPERRPGLGQQQPGAATGTSLPYATCFDQDRLEAGNGACVGRRATGQSAANNRDLGEEFTAKPWMVGATRAWKVVDPWRDSVACTHQAFNP
jgi:hypothetical protein